MGEPSVVAGGQQGQQGAILAGVEASAAGVWATGVNRLAGAEAEARDDATLALFLHCTKDNRVPFGSHFIVQKPQPHSLLRCWQLFHLWLHFKEEQILLGHITFGSSVNCSSLQQIKQKITLAQAACTCYCFWRLTILRLPKIDFIIHIMQLYNSSILVCLLQFIFVSSNAQRSVCWVNMEQVQSARVYRSRFVVIGWLYMSASVLWLT